MRVERLQVSGQDKPVEVEFERGTSKRNDQYFIRLRGENHEVQVVSGPAGNGWLHLNGRIVPFRVSRKDAMVSVWVGGRVFVFQRIQETAQRAGASAHTGVSQMLAAPMPGTIIQIHARAGNSVSPHESLVVMESMKMELTLSIPHASTIGEVVCHVGQLVELGQVLVTFNDAASTPSST